MEIKVEIGNNSKLAYYLWSAHPALATQPTSLHASREPAPSTARSPQYTHSPAWGRSAEKCPRMRILRILSPPPPPPRPSQGDHPPRVIRPAHRLIHPLTHIQKFAEYPVPLGLCTSHAWSSMGEAQAHPDDSDTREANERPAKAVGQDGGGALNVGVKRRDAAGLGLEGWPSGRLAKEPREAGRRASCSVRRARAQVCSAVHGSSFPQESLRWGAQCRALRASSCRERKPDLRGPSIGRQVI